MDDIKVEDIIFICHYSGINPFKCTVVKKASNTLVVKFAKEFAALSFIQGDPAVIGIDRSSEMVILGGTIVAIASRQNCAEIKLDTVNPPEDEHRLWERIPVSLYADIRLNRKKEMVTIKNISCYGMLVFSNADLPLNEKLDIDIYLEKKIFFLKINIVRKLESEYHFEYGVGIVYEDSSSLNSMRDYIQRLKNEQEDSIRKLKGKT